MLELGSEPTSEGVVAAVVQLAHAVKLAVVAEGAETHDQLAVLRRLGVDAAQGYLFAVATQRRPCRSADPGRRLGLE